MKKRLIAMLLLAAMMVGLLCGCKEEKTSNAAETTAPIQDIGIQANLVFAYPAGEEELAVLNDHIIRFYERYPGIQIQVVTELDLTAEELPTVLALTADEVAALAAENKLIELDGWINDDGYTMNFQGAMEPIGIPMAELTATEELFYGEGKQFGDDTTYAVPLYRESLLTYYNGTFFEENDLSTPYCWENLEIACQKMKEINPDAVPVVCNDVMGLFLAMCAQKDACYTNEDGIASVLSSQAAMDALTTLNRWYNLGYLTTNTILGEDGLLSPENGVCAVIDSSAAAGKHSPVVSGESFAFEMGVANTIIEMDGQLASPVKGRNLAIVSDDDEQILAAWVFIHYLCSDASFQTDLAIAGSYVPVEEDVWVNDTYSDYLNEANGGDKVEALAALFCMEQQHTYFTIPGTTESANIAQQIETMVMTAMTAPEGDLEKIDLAIQTAMDACA